MRLHNRQIKASYRTDGELLRWPRGKRDFYLALSQAADDSGCVEDDPFALKMLIFPSPLDTDITVELIEQWIAEMTQGDERAKLVPYTTESKRCLFMRNFHKHQQLRNPAAPDVPLPEWIIFIPSSIKHRSGNYAMRNDDGKTAVLLTGSKKGEVINLTGGVEEAHGDPADEQHDEGDEPVPTPAPKRQYTRRGSDSVPVDDTAHYDDATAAPEDLLHQALRNEDTRYPLLRAVCLEVGRRFHCRLYPESPAFDHSRLFQDREDALRKLVTHCEVMGKDWMESVATQFQRGNVEQAFTLAVGTTERPWTTLHNALQYVCVKAAEAVDRKREREERSSEKHIGTAGHHAAQTAGTDRTTQGRRSAGRSLGSGNVNTVIPDDQAGECQPNF
jgi:hypothetical protein